MENTRKWKRVEGILRLSLSFPFIYAAMAGYFSPDDWASYFPGFVSNIMPPTLALGIFGLVELIIAIYILIGKKIFWPSIVAAAMLLGIVVSNPGGLSVLFRDLSIFGIAIALAIL